MPFFRTDALSKFEFTFALGKLEPWPAPRPGEKPTSLVISWARGAHRSGFTAPARARPGKSIMAYSYDFGEKVYLPATLYKDTTRIKASSPQPFFRKKCIVFTLHEGPGALLKPPAGSAVGTLVINLADFAAYDGKAAGVFYKFSRRSVFAAVGEPELAVTISCRWVSSSGMKSDADGRSFSSGFSSDHSTASLGRMIASYGAQSDSDGEAAAAAKPTVGRRAAAGAGGRRGRRGLEEEEEEDEEEEEEEEEDEEEEAGPSGSLGGRKPAASARVGRGSARSGRQQSPVEEEEEEEEDGGGRGAAPRGKGGGKAGKAGKAAMLAAVAADKFKKKGAAAAEAKKGSKAATKPGAGSDGDDAPAAADENENGEEDDDDEDDDDPYGSAAAALRPRAGGRNSDEEEEDAIASARAPRANALDPAARLGKRPGDGRDAAGAARPGSGGAAGAGAAAGRGRRGLRETDEGIDEPPPGARAPAGRPSREEAAAAAASAAALASAQYAAAQAQAAAAEQAFAMQEMATRVAAAEEALATARSELRDVALLEVAVGMAPAALVADAVKLHTPAVRLFRVLRHTRRRAAAPSEASRFVRRAAAALAAAVLHSAEDLSRLCYWWSNCAALRVMLSDQAGAASGGAAAVMRDFGASLELIEGAAHDRVLGVLWEQHFAPLLEPMPRGGPLPGRDAAFASGGGKAEEPDVIALWVGAFEAAERRLTGRPSAVAAALLRQVVAHCLRKLDGALFAALVKGPADGGPLVRSPAPPPPPAGARGGKPPPADKAKAAPSKGTPPGKSTDGPPPLPLPPAPALGSEFDAEEPPVGSHATPVAGLLSFGAGIRLKMAVAAWEEWAEKHHIAPPEPTPGGAAADAPGPDGERAGVDPVDAGGLFGRLRAAADLLMLPKESLADPAMRHEICALSAGLTRRLLGRFEPDDFSPDPLPGGLLRALELSAAKEGPRSGALRPVPLGYVPPTGRDLDVAPLLAVAGREGVTGSDEGAAAVRGMLGDLSAMEAPIAALLGGRGNGPDAPDERFRLFRETWNAR